MGLFNNTFVLLVLFLLLQCVTLYFVFANDCPPCKVEGPEPKKSTTDKVLDGTETALKWISVIGLVMTILVTVSTMALMVMMRMKSNNVLPAQLEPYSDELLDALDNVRRRLITIKNKANLPGKDIAFSDQV